MSLNPNPFSEENLDRDAFASLTRRLAMFLMILGKKANQVGKKRISVDSEMMVAEDGQLCLVVGPVQTIRAMREAVKEAMKRAAEGEEWKEGNAAPDETPPEET